MTEVERDGLALENLLVILTRKLGDAAYHPTASAVSPQLGDALDGALHGIERGLLRMVRRVLAADDANDPYIEQREKIMGEVLVSYERLGTALIIECSTWLSRRIKELERGDRADLEPEVERGLGHGAG